MRRFPQPHDLSDELKECRLGAISLQCSAARGTQYLTFTTGHIFTPPVTAGESRSLQLRFGLLTQAVSSSQGRRCADSRGEMASSPQIPHWCMLQCFTSSARDVLSLRYGVSKRPPRPRERFDKGSKIIAAIRRSGMITDSVPTPSRFPALSLPDVRARPIHLTESRDDGFPPRRW